MKLIVDMLESDYEVIINHCDDYVKSLYNEPEERCILAVKNGTVLPDKLTNGAVICLLYPNLRYVIQNDRVITTIGVASSFDLDWWNAPYREDGE